MVCKQCGAELVDTARFCFRCGAGTSGDAPAADLPVGTPPQDMPPQDMPPQDMPPQDMPPQNIPPQNIPPQNMPPQNIPPQNMPPQNMPPQNMPPQAVWGPPVSPEPEPDEGEKPEKKSKAPIIILIVLLSVLLLAVAGVITLKILNDKGVVHIELLDELDGWLGGSGGSDEKEEAANTRKNRGETTEEASDKGKESTTSVPDTPTTAEPETQPAVPEVATLMADPGGSSTNELTPVFGNGAYKRKDITAVSFSNNVNGVPAAGAWDVSAAKDGSVKAWVTSGHLFIVSAGKIRPQSCTRLFYGYINAVSVDFGGIVDTSEVTDMSAMFGGDVSLTSIDLTGISTARVTDMSYMFFDCLSMPAFHLESFSISATADVKEMFGLTGGKTRKNQNVRVYTNGGSYTLENTAPADPGPGVPTATGTYKVNTTWLRLRTAPSLEGVAVGQIAQGTVVTVTEVRKAENTAAKDAVYWGKITYNGNTYWVAMYYLTPVN